jgi:hypothetical protein
MGGIAIIGSVLAYTLAHLVHLAGRPPLSGLLLLGLFAGLGFLGFLDDWIKISKERSLGLNSRGKLIGQFADRRRVRVRLAAQLPRRARPHARLARPSRSCATSSGCTCRWLIAVPVDHLHHRGAGPTA